MVQDSNIVFTKSVVEKLEGFADQLDSIRYESEDWEVIISLFLLYLESSLPNSNIYDFVVKTDDSKSEKLNLQEKKRLLFEKINENVESLKVMPDTINQKWDDVRDHYDVISETEGTINPEVEEHYNEIKKLEKDFQEKVQKQYELIREKEEKRNSIVDEEYFTIKTIESDIEDIHSKMKTISEENDVLYKEVEMIDHTLSDIDNNIEESEWKVELDSPEEKVFELVKNKLIINKRLKYGDI
jgi:uncharacterized coiled-coil DUF342 family protein